MKAIRERERLVQAAEQAPRNSRLGSLASRAFAPVDIASLVFFRVAFGGLLLWDVLAYLARGWVQAFYVEPAFHFTYYGFDWVRPWPGEGMVVHFALLGVLALMIMLGLWYRMATILFFLGITYVFLLEQAQYLNHVYLIILLSFLMIFVPANRAFSLDARGRPDFRSDTAPAWCLWVLRIQMGLVYLFGGIAKLNPDWLQGEPLRVWLAQRTDFPIIGGLFTEDWLVYLFAYGSLVLDLLAFPLLLWRRTRVPTFVAVTLFHIMNEGLFSIGIFPWLSIAATTLFFSSDWPRRLMAGRRQRLAKAQRQRSRKGIAATARMTPTRQRATVALLCSYVALQVLVPLRSFVYPGDVNWTEEGHRFSWRMKLRDKQAVARFFVTTPSTGSTFEVDTRNQLTVWQYLAMSTRPSLILEYAHYLGDTFSPPGGPPAEVRAHVLASLNSRPPQLLVDPRVDLARVEPGVPPADWIVPLGSDLDIPPPSV